MITIHAVWLLTPMFGAFIWSIWPLSPLRYMAALSIFVAFVMILTEAKP